MQIRVRVNHLRQTVAILVRGYNCTEEFDDDIMHRLSTILQLFEMSGVAPEIYNELISAQKTLLLVAHLPLPVFDVRGLRGRCLNLYQYSGGTHSLTPSSHRDHRLDSRKGSGARRGTLSLARSSQSDHRLGCQDGSGARGETTKTG